MSGNWEFGITSHTGNIKKVNEDAAFIRIGKEKNNNEIILAMIADGMGGYQAGEQASKIAIERVKEWWDERIDYLLKRKNPTNHITDELVQLLELINLELIGLGKEYGIKTGTTLSLILMLNKEYLILHIGDSRIYQLDTMLKQLTEDQSFVGVQVKQGRLTKEEARVHPQRNVLLQCLGVEADIEIIMKRGKYHFNDLFLLCSDGFFSLFSDEEIASMLNRFKREKFDLQTMSENLVERALLAGATDNIPVVLKKIIN